MGSKRRLTSKILRGAVLLLMIWGALACFALYKMHATKVTAEHFLEDFTKLQVGQSTMDQVKQLADKYGGKWSPNPTFYEANPCGAGASVVEFEFRNQWTLLLLLSPRVAIFYADIYVKHGVVCHRSVALFIKLNVFSQRFSEVTYLANEELEPRPYEPPFSSQMNAKAWIINMDVRATPEARAAAYALNMDCLDTLRGCRDNMDLAPEIRKNSRKVDDYTWGTRWDE